MTFLESAVLLAWVALALLAFGLAGLLRQVGLLTRRQLGGGESQAAAGDPLARTTRDLVGFRLPADGALADLLDQRAHRTLAVFVSPACPSCAQTLAALAAHPDVTSGSVALVAVSTGSCAPAEAELRGAGRCVPSGRALLEQLHVPATPYLVALDATGTIVAALLPHQDTDLGAWVRHTRGSMSLTEEQP